MKPLLALAALTTLAAAQTGSISHVPGLTLTGAGNELFARRVSAAGDVNDDGFADLLIYSNSEVSSAINGIARVDSGFDGAVLYTFDQIGNHTFDGMPLAGVGDIYGDGHDDFVIGSSLQDQATLYSGRTGLALHVFTGDLPDDGFGGTVAPAGDVDGDGHPDISIGCTGQFMPVSHGYARVFSGADFAELYTFHEESQLDAFGSAVAGAGDLNGDGRDDLVVGAYLDGIDYLDPGFPPFIPPFWAEDTSGFVTAYSGADGSQLWSAHGAAQYDELGWSLAPTGDVDGDGLPDLIAGSRSAEQVAPGYARVLSGADGHTLQTFAGEGLSSIFISVSGVGDLDGDGTPDLLTGNVDVPPETGEVHVDSGADGSELFAYNFPFASTVAVAGLGDVNGDGIGDFAAASQENFFGGGVVQLFVSQGAVAQASEYGCGLNPAGSLAVRSGTPAIGATLTLDLSDPSGSMGLPAKAFLLISSQPDAAFPCGSPKPGWGLAAPGSTGELLVDVVAPNPLLVLNVGTYTGSPVQVPLAVPSLPEIVGVSVYVQGALLDGTHRIGLTSALALTIGVP